MAKHQDGQTAERVERAMALSRKAGNISEPLMLPTYHMDSGYRDPVGAMRRETVAQPIRHNLPPFRIDPGQE